MVIICIEKRPASIHIASVLLVYAEYMLSYFKKKKVSNFSKYTVICNNNYSCIMNRCWKRCLNQCRCCTLPTDWLNENQIPFEVCCDGLKVPFKILLIVNSPQVCILSQNLYFDSKLNFISSRHFNQSCHLMVQGLPAIFSWCNHHNVTNLHNNFKSGRLYFE